MVKWPFEKWEMFLKKHIGPIFILLGPTEIDRNIWSKQVGFSCFFKILTSKKGHVFGPISSIKMSLMFRLPGICAFNLYGLLIKKKINFILFHFPGK